MAFLTGPTRPPGGARAARGQLLLASAFVISVLFVVLALVLNAVAVTGVLASGAGSPHSATRAPSLQDDVTKGTTALLAEVNGGGAASYDALHSTLTESIGAWRDMSARHASTTGTSQTVSLLGSTNGTRIRQGDADRNLTSASAADNWTLAPGVTRTKSYRLTVSRSSLKHPGGDTSSSGLESADVFRVVITPDGATRWRLFVYRSGSDDVVVAVASDTGGIATECSAAVGAGGDVTVDVTNRSIGTTPCPGLGFIESFDGPFDIGHGRGSNAVGTYRLDVDVPRSTLADSAYGPTGSETHPQARRIIYDATVRVHVSAPTYSFRSSVPVVPGDADG